MIQHREARNIVKTKSIRRVIIILIGAALLIFAFVMMIQYLNRDDSNEFYKEYGQISEIKKNNIYHNATKQEILGLLDDGTGVIYFGFPSCPWCRSMVGILNDVGKANGIEKIYYYNIKDERDELSINENNEIAVEKHPTEFYSELLMQLEGFTSKYTLKDENGNPIAIDTGKQRIYVPFVVFVKDGSVMFAHEETVSGHEDPDEKLNDKQITELKGIYQNGFNLIEN